jgi:hypothetical protein
VTTATAPARGLRDPATLLDAWEAGSGWPEVARGAVVLDVARACGAGSALDLPLGDLARLAARCHADAFGAILTGVLDCAGCGAVLDVTVDLAALPDALPGALPGGAGGGTPAVRAPTARDLLAAAGRPDARDVLVSRCVAAGTGALDDAALAAAEARLEALAGPALTTLRATCPACGAAVAGDLDPPWLLWTRVAAAGPELLRDVAALAAAYGWSEPQVLALSPRRRAAYLELAAG